MFLVQIFTARGEGGGIGQAQNMITGTTDCKSLATSKLNSGKPHMDLVIFPVSADPSFWLKLTVDFHCHLCLMQDFSNLL